SPGLFRGPSSGHDGGPDDRIAYNHDPGFGFGFESGHVLESEIGYESMSVSICGACVDDLHRPRLGLRRLLFFWVECGGDTMDGMEKRGGIATMKKNGAEYEHPW